MAATEDVERAAGTPAGRRDGALAGPDGRRLAWLDATKAVAMAWIFLVHVVEQVFGGSYFANPATPWPPLSERVEQLEPLSGLGIWTIPANLARWVGWLGDQGVSVFLVAAGFVLVPAIPRAIETAGLPTQWWHRLRTFLPMWWVTLGLFLLVGLVTASARYRLFEVSTAVSVVGLRLRAADLYAGAPSWWYVTLLVQLAIVAPFLVRIARRPDGVRALWAVLVGCVLVRAAGLVILSDAAYLDAWSRGAILVTRLPEVIAGVLLALRVRSRPSGEPWAGVRVSAAALAVAAGFVASFFLIGNAAANVLMGFGLFVLLRRALDRAGAWWNAPSSWVQRLGRHSLSVFLVHHPVVIAVIPVGIAFGAGLIARTAVAVVLVVLLAAAVEWLTRWFTGLFRTAAARFGSGRVLVGVGLTFAVLWAALVGAEVVSRRLAPEELRGWGERPSLEPSAEFGWTLRPQERARLRWLTYDYVIEANELGFPGTLPERERTPGVPRVLVTGDAFTSGEGVQPEETWPRLLADRVDAEVLNFGITGYGPDQEARVLARYVPEYRPDVIVVELFVNDFFDATTSDQQFRQSIGFSNPDPGGVWSYLAADNLNALLRNRVIDPLKYRLRGREERTEGWSLGQFESLERGAITDEMVERVAEDLRGMRATADANGAALVVVVVPSSAQMCDPSELPYWPRGVDLSAPRFDIDQPQRLLAEAARRAGIDEVHDLRADLAAEPCLYRKHNMHLTSEGQARLAESVTTLVLDHGLES